MKIGMRKAGLILLAPVIILAVLFSFIGCTPGNLKKPEGAPIDISGMKLVFNEEFDSGSLDESSWSTDKYWDSDHDYIRRGGYWDRDQLAFRPNGTLDIRTEYRDGRYGEGWYTGMLNTRHKREFTYGYFEVRCKVPPAEGLWAAFWMLSDTFETVSGNGHGGAEIDIMESPYYHDPEAPVKWYRNTTFHTVHIDGYGDDTKSKTSPKYTVQTDMYENYNTYGLMWTEDEYIFYINGVESWRTDFGVSDSPQYLILSVEISGKHSKTEANPSNPDNIYSWGGEITNNDRSIFPVDYSIDYVRVYQNIN